MMSNHSPIAPVLPAHVCRMHVKLLTFYGFRCYCSVAFRRANQIFKQTCEPIILTDTDERDTHVDVDPRATPVIT